MSNPNNKNESTVFVLVLNWNGWQDTVKCIESLKSLTYPNYEIVVLDNASTNDSVARIREVHPDVTLMETGANLGFSGGNNVGIRYALEKGAKYVWLLNNDTKVDPQALSFLVKCAEEESRIGLVGSILIYMDQPGRIQAWGGGKVSLYSGRPWLLTSPGQPDYISGASMLIRREVLETVGLLDENYFMYWDDVDYSFRVRKAGWALAVASDSIVYHKDSASTGQKSARMDVFFNSTAVRFFSRHARFPMLPITVGTVGRLLKRMLKGDWNRVRATLKGYQIGKAKLRGAVIEEKWP
ncbi:glycosyltransferase family 2 protein [Meiothermus cerbereus]|jgi:GT2 family glycosyltransferase|uniref:glycosyltransferase family 2 protein n=1 Tax=Meiothermus cerbereus TaxID=65552 RepID=UPI0031705AF3